MDGTFFGENEIIGVRNNFRWWQALAFVPFENQRLVSLADNINEQHRVSTAR